MSLGLRLKELGGNTPARMCIHTTRRLKHRILSQIPALEKHKRRREVFLAFKKDLANALQKTHKEDRDEEAIDAPCQSRKHLSKKLSFKYTFDGSLEANCQANSVPPSLVSLVNILYGPNIEMQASTLTKSQAGLSNCQLLQCNSYRRRCSRDVKRERRNKSCLRCTALCTRTEDCDYTWLLIKLYMVTFFFPKKTKYSYGAAFPVKNE